MLRRTLLQDCALNQSLGDFGIGGLATRASAFEGAILYASPLEVPSFTARHHKPEEFTTPGSTQGLATGASKLFLYRYPPHAVPYELAKGTFEPLIPNVEGLVTVGDTLIGVGAEPSAVVVAAPGRAPYLIKPETGRAVSEARVDRSTGNTLVWAESKVALDFVQPTLWSAPLADDLDGIVRTKIATLDDTTGAGGRFLIAHAGVVLMRTSKTSAILIRRSDGHAWTLEAEPDTIFMQTLWVDDDEIWILTGRPGAKDINRAGIVRFRRDALGPGAPLPK